MGGNDIPKKWIGCPKFSSQLIGDKFFCFKTPLAIKFTQSINSSVRNNEKKGNQLSADDEYFTITHVLESFEGLTLSQDGGNSQSKSKKRAIKTWINLTNTTRYFDSKEIVKAGIKYYHLAVEGGPDASPQPSIISKFNNICKSTEAGSVIGVHCTHGFNRTGFLICSYLAEYGGLTIDEAINNFKEHRPPGIYREGLLNQLVAKYGGSEASKIAPPTPSWFIYSEITKPKSYSTYSNNWRNNQGFQQSILPQQLLQVSGPVPRPDNFTSFEEPYPIQRIKIKGDGIHKTRQQERSASRSRARKSRFDDVPNSSSTSADTYTTSISTSSNSNYSNNYQQNHEYQHDQQYSTQYDHSTETGNYTNYTDTTLQNNSYESRRNDYYQQNYNRGSSSSSHQNQRGSHHSRQNQDNGTSNGHRRWYDDNYTSSDTNWRSDCNRNLTNQYQTQAQNPRRNPSDRDES